MDRKKFIKNTGGIIIVALLFPLTAARLFKNRSAKEYHIDFCRKIYQEYKYPQWRTIKYGEYTFHFKILPGFSNPSKYESWIEESS